MQEMSREMDAPTGGEEPSSMEDMDMPDQE